MRSPSRSLSLFSAAGALLAALAWPGADDRRAADAQEAANPPRAATLVDAQRAIDLREFPMLAHGEVFHKTRAKVGYVIEKPDFAADVQFYRSKLTDAGWKIDSEDVDAGGAYGLLDATRQGYCLSVSVVKNPTDGRMHAFVENYGNVDTRQLPRFASAALKEHSKFRVVQYTAEGKLDAVMEFVRTEFSRLGWREVLRNMNDRPDVKPGKRCNLHFVQNGVTLNVSIDADGDRSNVRYYVSLMVFAPPIPAEMTGAATLLDPPLTRLFFTTRTAPADIFAFYRRELPGLGWSIVGEPEKVEDGVERLPLTGIDGEALRLDVLAQDGLTHVLIAARK